MRVLAALAGAVGLACATPALACLPPPPPNWDAWLGDPSVDIFLGRVESVETLAPVRTENFVVTPGVAHIRRLEIIQGQPSAETAQATGALSVAYGPTPSTMPLCIDYLNHKPGDLVVVVRGGAVFGRQQSDVAALAAYFGKHQ